MSDRWDDEAARLSPCTCGDDRPVLMVANGCHFANCPTENQPDIADALRAAYEAGRAEANR